VGGVVQLVLDGLCGVRVSGLRTPELGGQNGCNFLKRLRPFVSVRLGNRGLSGRLKCAWDGDSNGLERNVRVRIRHQQGLLRVDTRHANTKLVQRFVQRPAQTCTAASKLRRRLKMKTLQRVPLMLSSLSIRAAIPAWAMGASWC
jgi:hypothetical protein